MHLYHPSLESLSRPDPCIYTFGSRRLAINFVPSAIPNTRLSLLDKVSGGLRFPLSYSLSVFSVSSPSVTSSLFGTPSVPFGIVFLHSLGDTGLDDSRFPHPRLFSCDLNCRTTSTTGTISEESSLSEKVYEFSLTLPSMTSVAQMSPKRKATAYTQSSTPPDTPAVRHIDSTLRRSENPY